jgi:dihydroorotase
VPTLAAAASKYDLIIRGGRVIDASSGLDSIGDVAISAGRIAAVGPTITGEAVDVIDARGRIVAPGLIDIHTHVGADPAGPTRVLQDGVTGWIDAGSQGADRIAEPIANARSAPQLGRLLVNIGRAGVLPEGDTMDLNHADVAAASNAIAANREFIVGVKARLSANVAGQHDYEVLQRAQRVANAFRLPLMIHMGQTASPLKRLLALLKPGDIVTHMFAPPPHGIIDDRGRILPEVLDARRRGVWFDVGNGRNNHLRWDIVATVMAQGFWPDTISTDWSSVSPTNAVGNLPNCMSKFFNFGMTVSDVIACVTSHAARVFPAFGGRGTLKEGAPADVALLELRRGTFQFIDNFDQANIGRQKLFPSETVIAGKRVPKPA